MEFVRLCYVQAVQFDATLTEERMQKIIATAVKSVLSKAVSSAFVSLPRI